jgi:hypothetical protein
MLCRCSSRPQSICRPIARPLTHRPYASRSTPTIDPDRYPTERPMTLYAPRSSRCRRTRLIRPTATTTRQIHLPPRTTTTRPTPTPTRPTTTRTDRRRREASTTRLSLCRPKTTRPRCSQSRRTTSRRGPHRPRCSRTLPSPQTQTRCESSQSRPTDQSRPTTPRRRPEIQPPTTTCLPSGDSRCRPHETRPCPQRLR